MKQVEGLLATQPRGYASWPCLATTRLRWPKHDTYLASMSAKTVTMEPMPKSLLLIAACR